MDYITDWAGLRDFIWVIPLMFSIHEVEEWNILKWYRKYYKNLPESTNTSIRIHIVVLSLVSVLLTLLAVMVPGNALFAVITVFMSVFILLNFLQHVICTIQLRAYSPGLFTGIMCIMVITGMNVIFALNGFIALPYYLMTLFIVPSLVGTLKVKGEMTKGVRNVHNFFIRVEKALAGILPKH